MPGVAHSSRGSSVPEQLTAAGGRRREGSGGCVAQRQLGSDARLLMREGGGGDRFAARRRLLAESFIVTSRTGLGSLFRHRVSSLPLGLGESGVVPGGPGGLRV